MWPFWCAPPEDLCEVTSGVSRRRSSGSRHRLLPKRNSSEGSTLFSIYPCLLVPPPSPLCGFSLCLAPLPLRRFPRWAPSVLRIPGALFVWLLHARSHTGRTAQFEANSPGHFESAPGGRRRRPPRGARALVERSQQRLPHKRVLLKGVHSADHLGPSSVCRRQVAGWRLAV